MGNRIVKWLGVGGVAAVLLAGCAANRSSDSPARQGHFPLADSEAALGYEKADWDQPFWERWIADARAEARASASADRSGVQSPSAPVPAVQARGSLRPKLGIYIDSENGISPAAYQLVNALERHAAEYGLTILQPGVLSDAIGEQSACSAPLPSDCRQALAVYPGTRALLVLNVGSSGANGEVAVLTQLIDADFGIDYAPVTAQLPLSPAGSAGAAELSVWSNRVLDMAATRIAIAPWFTHSFAQEGEDVYVSAGRRSGLDAGTVLAVHEGGSLVRAPGGQIVAWNPGPVVGRLKVKQLIGQRMAVAESISGRMPQPQDKLTVVE